MPQDHAPRARETTNAGGLARVLCAVRCCPASEAIVETAVAAAARDNAEIRLFHVLDPRAGGYDAEDVLRRLFLLARRVPGRPRLSAAVVTGAAAQEIERHVRVFGAELLVMGADAGGLDGSLAATIALATGIPVLTAPAERAWNVGDAVERTVGQPSVLCVESSRSGSLTSVDVAFAIAERLGAAVYVTECGGWSGDGWQQRAARDAEDRRAARY